MSSVARILVVDDSEDGRMIALAMLEDGGFENVEAVEDAQQAYGALGIANEDAEPAFDIILLDIVMPNIDGVEACARIRASRRYRDVPILMVSSQRETEVLNQAFIAGANDYVLKPVNQIELLARVRSSLRFKRELDRRRSREAELRGRTRKIEAAKGGYSLVPGSSVLNRQAFETHIRAMAEAGGKASLLAIAIEELAPFRREMGEGVTERLIARVARNLETLPAPLGAVIGHHGDGVFMVAAPGDQALLLQALGDEACALIEALCIHHGSSAAHDHVRLRTWRDGAAGEALLDLPARLIASGEVAMRREIYPRMTVGMIK